MPVTKGAIDLVQMSFDNGWDPKMYFFSWFNSEKLDVLGPARIGRISATYHSTYMYSWQTMVQV